MLLTCGNKTLAPNALPPPFNVRLPCRRPPAGATPPTWRLVGCTAWTLRCTAGTTPPALPPTWAPGGGAPPPTASGGGPCQHARALACTRSPRPVLCATLGALAGRFPFLTRVLASASADDACAICGSLQVSLSCRAPSALSWIFAANHLLVSTADQHRLPHSHAAALAATAVPAGCLSPTMPSLAPAPSPGRHLRTEADGHAQHDRTARYFGPGRQRLERSTRLKRWRRGAGARQQLQGPGSSASGASSALLGWQRPSAPAQPAGQGHAHPPRMQLPSPGYLPLRVEEDAGAPAGLAGPRGAAQAGQPPEAQRRFPLVSAAEELAVEQAAAAARDGETDEELLLRRTREFNLATRERPHDVQLWLEFARFQVGGPARAWRHTGWDGQARAPASLPASVPAPLGPALQRPPAPGCLGLLSLASLPPLGCACRTRPCGLGRHGAAASARWRRRRSPSWKRRWACTPGRTSCCSRCWAR